MADIISPMRRSALMARVKDRDTKPEMAVRRALHAAGYRYRLHRRDLPGTPDLVFSPKRCAIFVHGCFWHGHHGCRKAGLPKTRTEFWTAKIDANRSRDAQVQARLRMSGWRTYVAWECETKDMEHLVLKLMAFLGS